MRPLDELAGWELGPPELVADCGYGEVGCFRGGLDDRQIPYVVQVKAAGSELKVSRDDRWLHRLAVSSTRLC